MAYEQEATSQADMAAALAAKRTLRLETNRILSQIVKESVHDQSLRVIDSLLSLKEYRQAKRISVYLTMQGKEIQTARIVRDALDSGKTVFVPYIHKAEKQGAPTSVMEMLALHSAADCEAFELDRWGIPTIPSGSVAGRENCFGGFGTSPNATAEQNVGLDLIVMPGMAFDRKLGRLGHGKGYYDRFLSRCADQKHDGRAEHMPLLVGLALNEQVLRAGEEVPMSAHDWRLDRLLSADAAP